MLSLKKGDEIRIIAPSFSFQIHKDNHKDKKIKRVLEELWFKVSFSENCFDIDNFLTSSIEKRVEDLHSAFLDKNVKMILCACWWYLLSEIIPFLDYDLIKENPKIIMWFSDITHLLIEINRRCDFPTFSWPTASSLSKWLESEIENIRDFFILNNKYIKLQNPEWYSYKWEKNDDWNIKKYYKEKDMICLIEWKAKWKALSWTLEIITRLINNENKEYFDDKIWFLESYKWNKISIMQDLSYIKNLGAKPKAIVFWRSMKWWFKKEEMAEVFNRDWYFNNIPIIINASFGHTYPNFIIPNWFDVYIDSYHDKQDIQIIKP